MGNGWEVNEAYRSNRDLPVAVRKVLPSDAQTTWRMAYNSATTEEGEDPKAASIAWGAVSDAGFYRPPNATKWKKREEGTSEAMTKEAAIPAHETPTADDAWDGPAAVAAIPDDAGEDELKAMFAWVDDSGDPEAKASYSFPHHDPDGAANLKACSAIIAALNGGRGGADIPTEDRKGVWEHAAKHLEDGGAEEVPPLSEADLNEDADKLAALVQMLTQATELATAIASEYGGGDGGGDAGPPKKDGPPMEAFDPKDRKAMEALAAAMLKDPNFAASVKKVAEDLAPKDIEGNFVALTERAVADDGTTLLRVIVPGWGSSGYYPPEVLERDGPKAFAAGTQMFWNHQTDAEEEARPEGDLRDLAGELIEDAAWDPEGPEGAGLYAKAKVFAGFRDVVEELAPHIGVSIRAMGKASHGSVEGREGPVIDALTHGRSVDFVTAPGAGGKVLSLFEAAGRKGDEQMDQKELKEAQDAAKAAKEELAKRDAADIVRDALTEAKLPEAAKTRLSETLKPELAEDGSLDTDAWKTTVTEAVASEVAYLTEVTGAGQIRNMGGEGEGDEGSEDDLAEAFQVIGLPESTAKIAAAGRK